MRPSDVSALLAPMIRERYPVLLVGPPGVGKSDLVAQAAEVAKADLIVSHPVVDDPTAAKGYPWLQAKRDHADHVPYGELYKALNAKKPTVWFLDDLGQALPAVQASYMQLLLTRSSNGRKLPAVVTFVAATNRRTDRAGVTGILEPVKSRFVTIVHLETNLDDWCQWAIRTGQQPELIAFLRFRPELLHKFTATLDLVNSPSPRTWASVGKILRLKLSPRIELAAIQGAVGEGAAAEVVAFLRIFRELPTLDGILLDPDSAKIPDSAAALYAVATGLASKVTASNFARIARYADRLYRDNKGEFAVLMVRDAIRHKPEVQNTPAFIQLASTSVGKLFAGEGG